MQAMAMMGAMGGAAKSSGVGPAGGLCIADGPPMAPIIAIACIAFPPLKLTPIWPAPNGIDGAGAAFSLLLADWLVPATTPASCQLLVFACGCCFFESFDTLSISTLVEVCMVSRIFEYVVLAGVTA